MLMKTLPQSKFAGSRGQTTLVRKALGVIPPVDTAPVITARALTRVAASSADIMNTV